MKNKCCKHSIENFPYVVKFLPTEGIIEVGDAVSLTGQIFTVSEFTEDGKVILSGNEVVDVVLFGLNARKVAPVLCSLDIHPDDEVIVPASLGIPSGDAIYSTIDMEEGIVVMTFLAKEGSWVYCYYPNNPEINDFSEHPYRIIGEISKKAVWVKDGDRLAESDVRFIMINPEYPQLNYPVDEEEYLQDIHPDFKRIEIFNPSCKHFH